VGIREVSLWPRRPYRKSVSNKHGRDTDAFDARQPFLLDELKRGITFSSIVGSKQGSFNPASMRSRK